MGVGELLDRIREQYVSQFAAAAKKLARRRGVEVLSEVALVNDDGAVVGAGVLGLPLRIDLMALQGDKATDRVSVDSDKLFSFQPITFGWSHSLSVRLGPFPWDSMAFRVPLLPGSADWSPLIAWFRAWFRQEEDGAGEPLGVIHFLSDPEAVGNGTRFTADLGSAPVEAFEGLLDAVAALGASEVVIGEDADAEPGAPAGCGV